MVSYVGALLQRVNRDTQKCAFKCSYVTVNGKGVCLLAVCVWMHVCVYTPRSLARFVSAYLTDLSALASLSLSGVPPLVGCTIYRWTCSSSLLLIPGKIPRKAV